MTAIDDLKTAVRSYSTDRVATEIVDFSISSGATLNVGETFKFRVRITNQGGLFMQDVTVGAFATEFADVRTESGSTFGGSAASGAFDLPAGDVHTTGHFVGRAKVATGAGARDIVTARINGWNPDWDNLLRDNSIAGAKEGKLTTRIASD